MGPPANKPLAPPPTSFRQFFLMIGIVLIGLAGFITVQLGRRDAIERGYPVVIIVGGIGAILLVLGLVIKPRPTEAAPPAGQATSRELGPRETLLERGVASLVRPWSSAGGHLCLTNERLLFFDHGLNVGPNDLAIPLADIVHVEKSNRLGIIPNAILVESCQGAYRFQLLNRKRWLERILEESRRVQAARK